MNEHLNGVRGDARKRIEAKRAEQAPTADASLLRTAQRNSVMEFKAIQWDVRRMIRRRM